MSNVQVGRDDMTGIFPMMLEDWRKAERVLRTVGQSNEFLHRSIDGTYSADLGVDGNVSLLISSFDE